MKSVGARFRAGLAVDFGYTRAHESMRTLEMASLTQITWANVLPQNGHRRAGGLLNAVLNSNCGDTTHHRILWLLPTSSSTIYTKIFIRITLRKVFVPNTIADYETSKVYSKPSMESSDWTILPDASKETVQIFKFGDLNC